MPLQNKVTSQAYRMGIPLAAGTDVRYTEPGLSMVNEAIYLQKAGLSLMKVIQAMTYGSAKCLGIQDRTGTIKIGMEADFVILKQNPLKDLNALRNIVMVVNDGQIVVKKMQE